MERTEVKIGFSPLIAPCYCLKQDLSVNLVLTNLASLADQESLGSTSITSPVLGL